MDPWHWSDWDEFKDVLVSTDIDAPEKIWVRTELMPGGVIWNQKVLTGGIMDRKAHKVTGVHWREE